MGKKIKPQSRLAPGLVRNRYVLQILDGGIA